MVIGTRPVNDPPQDHVFESQAEENHESTSATDEASCEEPGPSKEKKTTTKQRKSSKRPLERNHAWLMHFNNQMNK